jgi:hypothetical protein
MEHFYHQAEHTSLQVCEVAVQFICKDENIADKPNALRKGYRFTSRSHVPFYISMTCTVLHLDDMYRFTSLSHVPFYISMTCTVLHLDDMYRFTSRSHVPFYISITCTVLHLDHMYPCPDTAYPKF